MLAWDDLRFVLALSRHATATAAGKALGVNATTVTRRVQALEAHLGARLFDRLSSGAVVTEAGAAVVAAASKIEEELHGLDAEVKGLDAELKGKLRVTSMEVLFDLWRGDLVDFQRKYSRVELALLSTTRPVDLSRREADVAVRLALDPPGELVGRRLTEVFYAIYGSPRLVAQTKPKPDRSLHYADFPWLGWDEPYAGPTDRIIEAHAKGAEVPLRVNSMPLLVRSMEDGMGLSILPCFVGDRSERLVRVGPYFEGGLYLWVLTHEQLRRTARVRAFVDIAARLVERDLDLFLGQRPSSATIPFS